MTTCSGSLLVIIAVIVGVIIAYRMAYDRP